MDRPARIIGVPSDFGTNRRGVDMGPSAIRYAGIYEELSSTGVDCTDVGDVRVPRVRPDDPSNGAVDNAHHIDQIAEVSTTLADEVAGAIDDGELPVLLGGDHSLSIGSIAGSARDADVGVVWFDAHGDLNTPSTSPSGNVHGMPLAAALGWDEFDDMDWAQAPGLDEENIVWVGLRELDDPEVEAIRASDATAYPMSEIDERGINTVTEEAMSIASDGTDGIHVSLDMDWLDPQLAPGVGTPVKGGATYREAHAAMETVADYGDQLRTFEAVEVNPILDEHNETAELACELTASALGKRVL